MSELINNSEHRKEKLKTLIKSLHEGKTVDDVKEEFKKEFGEVSTTEISQIEQELVKEGLAIEEVQRLCDVHATVFNGSISDIHPQKDYTKLEGHPIHVLTEENKAIEKVINEEINPYLESLEKSKDKTSTLMLRVGFDRLWEIDIHYTRKENLIFPFLEKRGITSPPKVMWGVDDEIRADLKEIMAILSKPQFEIDDFIKKAKAVIKRVQDMISKENNILIPLMAETLTFYDWIKVDEATPEIGYCLYKPTKSWKKETPEETEKKILKVNTDEVEFDAGHLTQEEVNSLLNTIPIDLTFVDSNNKVKYFSSGVERIFIRPKTIIGRDVSMCHPPQSVHVVEAIVEDFRSGRKDHEDFWIRMGENFVYIRYFAVRNKEGKFLGTLEVTQNIKPITELEGEKRLRS